MKTKWVNPGTVLWVMPVYREVPSLLAGGTSPLVPLHHALTSFVLFTHSFYLGLSSCHSQCLLGPSHSSLCLLDPTLQIPSQEACPWRNCSWSLKTGSATFTKALIWPFLLSDSTSQYCDYKSNGMIFQKSVSFRMQFPRNYEFCIFQPHPTFSVCLIDGGNQ